MVQQTRTLTLLALWLPVALSLGGCPRSLRSDSSPVETGRSSSPAPNLPPPTAPVPQRPLQPPRENRLSPATRSLVTQAKSLLARGDINGASSTLDRALRIEPGNPLLWIERGRVRLVDSEPGQAEGCARKALALASGDRAAQAQAGRLLADALRTQGRNPEAAEVEARPYMH
jgi:tetratricopeptide (TPR) repeat protein